ncbi:unnamed protein product [Brachionus calyciflorus]|uniref:Uncharacterized protein n=1 Tax=Brachionus calyciflorus TaxID=104777 RepID=A0A813MBZ2_9BILA|nr:unnamed protein product [Brachionus calyciflorus]
MVNSDSKKMVERNTLLKTKCLKVNFYQGLGIFISNDNSLENRLIIDPKSINIYFSNFDAKFFFGLVNYLKESTEFRRNFYYFLNNIVNKKALYKHLSSNKNYFVVDPKSLRNIISLFDTYDFNQINFLEINAINLHERCDIIRVWTSLVNNWLNKKIRYDGYSAFFSTLGGAYSSLGEESYEHAKNAESISKKQLALAYAFNDPNAISRCKLFLAFSYIQLLKFKEANFILRNEYKYLSDESNKKLITDGKLRVMCIAGLKKLKFVYEQFKIKNAYFSDRGKLRS